MTTPARPGSFTGATDTASAGSYFGTTLLSGISDLVATDVASAQASANAAAASETSVANNTTAAAASATVAQQFATNAHNTQFTHSGSNYYSALHYATEVSSQTSLATTARTDAQNFATRAANSAFTYSGSSYFSALHYSAAASTSATTASNGSADAQKLAINAEDAQYTLSGGTQGYSALHYSAKATASATAASNSASTASGHKDSAEAFKNTASHYATKVDGQVPSTSDHSAKAHAIGGVGVTSVTGSASEWAIKATAVNSGSEHSAKSYAISGTAIGAGSAKQWAIGGGSGFARDTVVSGGEYSAKYWANVAANSVAGFDQVYYGSYSSDSAAQTAHTDAGHTVAAGDLYFSTSTNNVRFYNGSTWSNIAAVDTSAFASKGFATAMAIAL
tara:strand:+ start:253 stop:1431 length:1179 start_codon:yes stop_codon:yes gene_type:complete